MASEPFDRGIDNLRPFSETIQHAHDIRTTSPSALESAAAFLGGTGVTVSPELGGFDRELVRGEQRERLTRWADQRGLLTTADSGQEAYRRLLHASDWISGNEHSVVVAPEEARVFKLTHTDRFGKAYPRVAGLAVYREATPLEYLTRLLLCNQAFGDDLRLEQVLLDEHRAVRIVTSQPIIVGTHPLEDDLHRQLYADGFEPLEAVDGVPTSKDWFRLADRVLIFDAHNGNYIQTIEGLIIPIDIYAEHVP